MAIKVSCSCGQSFSAKKELQGQAILCPKCHQPLTIGAAAPKTAKSQDGMDDLFEEVGLKEVKGQRCPQCRAAVGQNAVLCVECGYNLQTGTKIAGAKIAKSGEQGHGESATVLLDRASQTLDEDRAELKKTLKQGAPAWVYLIALALVMGFAGAMLTLPKHQAFWHTATGLFVLGGLIIFANWIRIVIAAFFESTVQGLLCLIVVPYSLIYVAMRWSAVGGFFISQLLGGVIICGGFACQSLSAMLTPGRQSGMCRPGCDPRPKILAAKIAAFAHQRSGQW